jgi:uncharacterized membrane protein YkvA (DUF1232 family)
MPVAQRVLSYVPFIALFLRIYFAFVDKGTSIPPKVLLMLSLVYLISPIDLIPDVIPIAGQIDDLTVLGAAMKFLDTCSTPAHAKQAQNIVNRWRE